MTGKQQVGKTRNKAPRRKGGKGQPTTYRVRVDGGPEQEVTAGIRVKEILPATSREGFPVVAVRFNNKVASLDRPVDRDALIQTVDLSSRDGGLIYRRSLAFVLIRAFHDLFPDLKVYINHSLNRGYYGEVYNKLTNGGTPQRLAQTDVDRLKARMRQLVEEDVPFRRAEVPMEEAIRLFKEAGMEDKAALLKFRGEGPTSIYHFGPIINHFYGQLLPSTRLLKHFDLHLCDPGFVLLFPPHGRPEKLPEYVHQEKIFAVCQEYEQWSRILQVRTVAHLNELVDTREINEYVLIAEALQEKKLSGLADMITDHPGQPRLVLLSGPSSSGKTTSVKRLTVQLRVNGLRPLFIGLDDFFVERDRTPKDETGEFDFEAFGAIDVELLQDCVRRLLKGEEVALPKFDFVKGRPEPGRRVRLHPNQPLLLEGIHALNPELLPQFPDGWKYKVYISPLTHLNIDDHNRIASSDARLIRRLVRDNRYRGHDAVSTLGRWQSVRRGEERNIFPYQEQADFIFNSSLPYEVCVLKQFALPVLEGVPREDPLFSEAARLRKFMSYFREIKPELVPRHSLLREFIGGSSFKY